jgi:hypothetical protein
MASNAPVFVPQKNSSWFGGLFDGNDAQTVSQFGSENVAKPRVAQIQPVKQITARLASYSFAPTTHTFTVEFDNGQVWRQILSDANIAVMKKPANTYVANVKRGFLGRYLMHISGVTGGFEVERIK